MENILELIKEWNECPEMHGSYPEGLSQYLSESGVSSNEAFDLISLINSKNTIEL